MSGGVGRDERRLIRVGVLTVSDLGAQGRRADASGDAVVAWAARRGHDVRIRSVVPDEGEQISGKLARWADSGEVDVIVTTGGTGLAPRDVTPEATAVVLERPAPGIAEALRAAAAPRVPHAWLSRGVAGVRGAALIVNLPGAPAAVRDGLKVLDRLLDHAVALLAGASTSHESSPRADA